MLSGFKKNHTFPVLLDLTVYSKREREKEIMHVSKDIILRITVDLGIRENLCKEVTSVENTE